METKKRNIYILLVMLTSMVIAIPLLIEILIFSNSFISNISNGEWASFLGSYIGGVLGGLGTLIGVLLTLNYGIKSREESNRMSVLPYININCNIDMEQFRNKGKILRFPHIIINKDRPFVSENVEQDIIEEEYTYLKFKLSNIGLGTAVNIDIDKVCIGQNTLPDNHLMTNGNMSIALKDESTELDIIITRNKSENRTVFLLNQIDENMTITLRFNDLLGNHYLQNVNLNSMYTNNIEDLNYWSYMVSSHEAPILNK